VRRTLRFLVLGALIPALASTAFSTEPESRSTDTRVNDAIAAIIYEYGGEEVLRSIRGAHVKGVQLAVRSHAIIRVERWFAHADRLRLELAYPDHHETRYTDGVKGWVGSSVSDLRPANRLKLQAMRLQTARFDLPLRLLDHAEEVVWHDIDESGRIVLRLPIDTDLFIDCHVALGSFRIERVSMWVPGPPAIRFAVGYEKFHEIDGTLIPFSEVTYMGTAMTSRFEVTEFEWNPVDLDAALQSAAAGATL